MKRVLIVASFVALRVCAQTSPPAITLVANAEGENQTIAPNTWVEVKGQFLSRANDSRIWQSSDFAGNQLPQSLDGVSVTVGGKNAYVYYISPAQIDILTPPNAISGSVAVIVTTNGGASQPYMVQAAALSPSFFVFNGGPYVAATHPNGSFIGPTDLYPGQTTPAKPGETVALYANGFGSTSPPVTGGSVTQGGTLSPSPSVTIGGIQATVSFAGLVAPGEFQFNVVVPSNLPNGDNALVATYNGVTAAPAAAITVLGSGSAPSTETFFVAPDGNDSWSGRLAAPNSTRTDGPFATMDRARVVVGGSSMLGLTAINVQFRAGTYYLSSPVMFGSTDSGSAATQIVYQNYPRESPVISGGVRVQNWTNVGGNQWAATLPASTQYFESLFYNGTRRLRPRPGSGILGTYYRIASTVYLNNAAPPAAAPNANCSIYVTGLGWQCFDRFKYFPADPIAGTWKNLAPATGNPCNQPAGNQAIAGDIELLVFEQFSTSKLRVSCVDTANQIMYMTGPTGISAANYTEQGFITGNRYLIENVEDSLTQPGQWFLDRSKTPWTLTYLANPGENPYTDTVIVPQAAQVVVASGLSYVTFQGLTFEHDNFTPPPAGHISSENEPEIPGAVSFQNSSHITFDSSTMTQISGTGLDFIPCLGGQESPAYCVSNNLNAVITNNVVSNSAFYDIGAQGIRIGEARTPLENDANTPQFTTVENTVVEGYGRVIPAAFGIGQAAGHDNLYTHNDVYDGYHTAVSISQGGSITAVPVGSGNSNNTISFNHVHNLFQGIMNDGGSIRIEAGNQVFTAAGNKMLNNKIHDVTDASIMDSNGYGGHGLYMDNNTGLVDVENNLVYRVSGFAVYTPHGPAGVSQANTIKNNILAYARQAMVAITDPYQNGVPAAIPEVFKISNNLFYFDRSETLTPKFWVENGCVYAGGAPFTQFQLFSTNMYWRTDGAFANDAKAFYLQPNPVSTGPIPPCSDFQTDYTFFTFANWQESQNEDLQSVIQNPGFNNPAYPADDYSLANGSPGVGFVMFDPNLAGRSNPLIMPPAVAATFPTKTFNPATDY